MGAASEWTIAGVGDDGIESEAAGEVRFISGRRDGSSSQNLMRPSRPWLDEMR